MLKSFFFHISNGKPLTPIQPSNLDFRGSNVVTRVFHIFSITIVPAAFVVRVERTLEASKIEEQKNRALPSPNGMNLRLYGNWFTLAMSPVSLSVSQILFYQSHNTALPFGPRIRRMLCFLVYLLREEL